MTESPTPPVPLKSGSSCLIKSLIGLVTIALVIGGLWWWSNRPISPVVLTPQEKTAVEAKVEAIQKPPEPKY